MAPSILRLPEELLIKILSYVVGNRPPGVCLWNSCKAGSRWCGPRRLPTERYSAMLLVCRNFYYAGIEAYYGGVVFKFLSTDHLRAVTSSLGQDRKWCIKRIVINIELEVNKHVKKDGINEVWYLLRNHRDFETDPLSELPSLQSAKVLMGTPAAMNTEKTMDEIGKNLRATWSSKADLIEIEWLWRVF